MPILPINEELLPPSDDYVLKAILTHPDAKPALMDLISAVIGRTVTDVQIRNNELPVGDIDEKNERLDVNCVIDDGSQVDVEMQGSKLEGLDGGHHSLINKTVYYLADLHSSQKSKGVRYIDFVRTYQITFSAHGIFSWPEYVTESSMRTHTGVQISDQLNMIIIELNKLGDVLKKPVGDMTSLEMWSTFLGYASDPKQRKLINELLESKEAIGMAGTVLAEISKDEHERAKFLSRRKFETDMISNLLTVEERGRREGRKEGLVEGLVEGKKEGLVEGKKEGLAEGKKDIARKMKAAAILPIEQISQITGISMAEIEKL
jgi:predicted transposase/invertase (TIGR01784 family)